MGYRSGYVRVEVSEIIDEIDDDDLLAEIARRKLIPANGEALPIDMLAEIHRELLVGRTTEARVILERLLFPKWKSTSSAKNAYDMFRKSA